MKIFEEVNKELNIDCKSNEDVRWNFISGYYILSEKFIEKFQNKVNWIAISLSQKLSKEFIERHKDKINLEHLKENLLFQTDIGRDWFIGYVRDYQLSNLNEDISITPYPSKVYNIKVKIYYKDLISTRLTKKVVIIRKTNKYKIYGKKYGNVSRNK